MIDTIIFDLDGTLLDTLPDITDSLNFMLSENGFSPKSEKEVRGYMGGGIINLIEKVMPEVKDKEKFIDALTLYKEHYLKNQFNKTKPYSGVAEMLECLKKMDKKIAIVSNKGEKAVAMLAKMYFPGLINATVGDDFVRPLKPDAASVKYALALLDSVRAKTILVGDADTDIKAAQNCGVRSVGVTWGYRDRIVLEESRADAIVDSPEQLLTYLSSNGFAEK